MTQWNPMDAAPKDGTPILVAYDHDADPFVEDTATGRLTTYGAHCESGAGHMPGTGYCVAVWGGNYEEDVSGEGWGPWVYIPDYWFLHDGNMETTVNPVAWMPFEAFSFPRKEVEAA